MFLNIIFHNNMDGFTQSFTLFFWPIWCEDFLARIIYQYLQRNFLRCTLYTDQNALFYFNLSRWIVIIRWMNTWAPNTTARTRSIVEVHG